jgi:hypothetical protein
MIGECDGLWEILVGKVPCLPLALRSLLYILLKLHSTEIASEFLYSYSFFLRAITGTGLSHHAIHPLLVIHISKHRDSNTYVCDWSQVSPKLINVATQQATVGHNNT